MEDVWLSVEDDSSNSSFADSDIIDSETEAELYSLIHYEQNLHDLKCPTTESENSHTSDQMKNVSTEKNKDFKKNQSVCNSNSVSEDNVNNTISKTLESLIYNELTPKSNLDKRKNSDNELTPKLNLDKRKNSDNQLTPKLNLDKRKNSDNELTPKLNLGKRKNSYNHDKCNVSIPSKSTPIDINHNVKDTLLNNNKKRKTDDCSAESSSSSLVYKNCTDENDSSDSDSIIWTDVVEKEFLTNLNEDDIICLSSDSESESQFNCLQMSKRSEKDLKNLSMPNIKIGENVKDLWFINDRDLFKSRKSFSRRYHDNAEKTCTNCSGKGHNARYCPLPMNIKCYICGGSGHTGSVCTNRICGRCFNIGHDTRRCWIPNTGYCSLCYMKGHIQANCPDIWRRYHLTTDPGEIVRGECNNNPTFNYCWNCGESGHCGAVCNEPRGFKQNLPIWPCVVSYDDPENLLKIRLRSLNLSDRPGNSKKSRLNQINCAAGGNFPVPKANSVLPKGKKKKNKKKKKKCQKPNIKQENVGNVGHCPSEVTHNSTLDQNRLLQRCSNFVKGMREKNFPRTPKKNQSVISVPDADTVPEAVNIMLRKRQKNKEYRWRRTHKLMENADKTVIARLNNAIQNNLFKNCLKKVT